MRECIIHKFVVESILLFLELLIILFLVLLNGIFSMSEIALVSSRKSRLETDARNGDKKAKQALDLANSPNRFLSTVQIGITLIGILTGVYSGDKMTTDAREFLARFDLLKPYASPLAVGLVVLFITYLSLVLGELVPKRIGMSKPEAIAKQVAGPMNLLSKFTNPFIVLLGFSSDFLIRLFNLKPSDNTVTEEEVKSLIVEGTTGGIFEEIEKEIVHNVFYLGDRRVASLMTHRQEIVWLDVNDSPEEIKSIIFNTKHAVYPLCRGSLDEVIGLIYIKDLIDNSLQEKIRGLEALAREPLYLPETTRAYLALEKFRENKVHFGIIIDEYGSVMGVVTMHDIMDALVGDISEDDGSDWEIVDRGDNSYLIDGQLPFDEFVQHFEVGLTEADKRELIGFNTLGGFILHILEDIPETGEKFDWKNFTLEVVDMDKSRIDKVLVTVIPTLTPED